MSPTAAAQSYADAFVAEDANMTNADTIANDDDFAALASAYAKLGTVGGSIPGLVDADGDTGEYVVAQSRTARDAIRRAMDVRAGEVLDAAYVIDDETPAGIEQVTL